MIASWIPLHLIGSLLLTLSFAHQHRNLEVLGTTETPDVCSGSGSVWCSIEMPSFGHFGFEPPRDLERWKIAQRQAAHGDQILLAEVVKHFPMPHDFLDGDVSFRSLQRLFDLHVDRHVWFDPLIRPELRPQRPPTQYAARTKAVSVIGEHDSFEASGRAPIVAFGYPVFDRAKVKFSGPQIDAKYIDLKNLLRQWKEEKHLIERPYVAVQIGNENWGAFSGHLPNRTAKWGKCCEKYGPALDEFLDDPNLLMFVVNQHHNMTHPKVLSVPRGIPLHWENTERIVWDQMHATLGGQRKTKLMYLSSSSWGPRKRAHMPSR